MPELNELILRFDVKNKSLARCELSTENRKWIKYETDRASKSETWCV